MFALIALAASAWVGLLVLAPALPPFLAAVVYAVGSHICHQRPERSFHVNLAQLPVCARCTGIYVGAAIGGWLAVGSGVRRRVGGRSLRPLLVCAAVPTALTLVAEWSGAWAGSNSVRAVAGLPLGGVVALVVAQAVATLHYDRCALRRPIASSRPPTPT